MKNITLYLTLCLAYLPAFSQIIPCEEDFNCNAIHKHFSDCDIDEEYYDFPCKLDIPPISADYNYDATPSFHNENEIWGIPDFSKQDAINENNNYPITERMNENVFLHVLSLIDEGFDGSIGNLLKCFNLNCFESAAPSEHGFHNIITIDKLKQIIETDEESMQGIYDELIADVELDIDTNEDAKNYILGFLDGDIDYLIRDYLDLDVNDRPDCTIGGFSDPQIAAMVGSGGNPSESQMNIFSADIIGFDNLGNVTAPVPYPMNVADDISTGVNHYNGLAQSTINLLTLQNQDIQIPLSLEYQSAGIKVDQYGGDVGQSWQLNAGYAISRQINGLPDEFEGIVYGKGVAAAEKIGICVSLDGVGIAIGTGGSPFKKTWHFNVGSPEAISVAIFIPIFPKFALTINLTIKLQAFQKPQRVNYEEKGLGYLHLQDENKLGEFIFEISSVVEAGDFTNLEDFETLSDFKKSYFLESQTFSKELNDFEFLNPQMNKYISLLRGFGNLIRKPVLKTQKIDTEPDEFYISIPEYSGKFVFDQSGNILTIPHSDLYIEKKIVGGHLVEFTVHTTNGKEYIFGSSSIEGPGVEHMENVSYILPNHFSYYDTRNTLPNPINFPNAYMDQQFSAADLAESDYSFLFPFMCLPCGRLYKKSYENNYTIMKGPKYTSKWHIIEIRSKLSNNSINFEYDKYSDLRYYTSQETNLNFPDFDIPETPGSSEHKFNGKIDVTASLLNPLSTTPYIYTAGAANLTYIVSENIHTKYKISEISSEGISDKVIFLYEIDNPEIEGDKLCSKIIHEIDGVQNKAWLLDYDVAGEAPTGSIECTGPEAGAVNFSVPGEWVYSMYDDLTNNLFVQSLHNFMFSVYFTGGAVHVPIPVSLNFKIKARNKHIRELKERSSLLQMKSYHEIVDLNEETLKWQAEFKRAFLKTIELEGRDFGKEDYVSLTYFDEELLHELPKKFSLHKDMWGYYNGDAVEVGLLPEYSYTSFNSNTITYGGGGNEHLGLRKNGNLLPPRQDEADLDKCKIMALQKIKLKTGGSYIFDYELNEFGPGMMMEEGAGLRVLRLTKDADSGNPTHITDFEYELPFVINEPVFSSKHPINITVPDPLNIQDPSLENYVTVSSTSLNQWHMNKAQYIGYGKVREVFPENGSILYHFTTPEDHPPIIFDTKGLGRKKSFLFPIAFNSNVLNGLDLNEYPEPAMSYIVRDWRLGLSKMTEVFDESDFLLQVEENSYDFLPAKYGKFIPLTIPTFTEFDPKVTFLKNHGFQSYYPGIHLDNQELRFVTQNLHFFGEGLEVIPMILNLILGQFNAYTRFINKYNIYAVGEYEFEQVIQTGNESTNYFEVGDPSHTQTEIEYKNLQTYWDYISPDYDIIIPVYSYPIHNNTVYSGSSEDIIKDQYFYYTYDAGLGFSRDIIKTNLERLDKLKIRSYNVPLRQETFLDEVLVDGQIKVHNFLPLSGNDIFTVVEQAWGVKDETFVLNTFIDEFDDRGNPEVILKAEFDKVPYSAYENAIEGPSAVKDLYGFLPPISLSWSAIDDLLLTKTITSNDGTMDESYEYTDFKELKKKTDIHGQIHEFEYDEFGRLLNSSNNNSLVQKSYEYTFIPNTVKETTEFGGNIATPTQESTSYFDGFGKVEKIVRSDAAVLQFNKYDSMFRLKESESLGGGNTIIEYQANPLNRKMSEVDAEDNLTQYEYLGGDSEYPTSFSSSLITDANGHESKIIQDGIGRNLASISGEGNKTKFFYDDQGRIDKILNPENQEFLYAYNGMGTVETKLVPNSATETSYYNERMQVIAVDDGINGFLYEYDDLLRLINVYFVKGGIMLSVNNSTGVADNAGYLSAIAAAGDPIQEFEFNATTHLLIRNKENILFDDKTTFYKETILGYDGFLRVNHESVSYPDEMISVIYEHQYNGASMPVNSLIDYDGTKYRTATDYDNLLRLSVMNHAHDKVQGVRAKIELNYNEKDQLKNKNLGFTIGQNYSILQTVDFEYDLIGRLLEINDIEENECNYDYLEEETCYLEYDELLCITEEGVSNPCSIPGGSGNENNFDFFDCYVIRNIEINGVVHPIDVYKNPPPSSGQNPFNFYLLAQNVNELREFLQQFIEDLGFSGEVQIRRSQVSGQPYMRRFRIVVANGNINSLKLLSDHCEFELELDCCEPDPDPPMAQALALSTTNPDLYAQKITYNYLDIQQIDYFNGCLTGIITNIYEYDADHRLKETDNRIKLGPHQLNGLMDESYVYDDAGNIEYLNRKGIIGWDYNSLPISSEIDILNYSYSSNKELNSVIDAKPGNFGVRSGTTNYSYDARGNITSSSNSNGGYAITYNPLNLPYEITGDDGVEEIWYTAGAEKFKIISPLPQNMNRTRVYLRNLELELHEEEYRPVAYNHSDGRLFFSFQPTIFTDQLGTQYQFQITDHLGNIMVQFEDRNYDGVLGEDDGLPSSDILVRNHYYSFGMLQDNTWQGIAPGGRAQLRYKYNGKELHKGSRLLDYGFRYYDPGIGRFTGVDRFSEKYTFQSPYVYAVNDPIKYIDVNGDSIAIRVDKKNVAMYENGNLYNRDGSQYTGKGVKLNKDGSTQLKGFLKSTVSALDEIRTGGIDGNKLVSTLQSDKDIFLISQGENSNIGRTVKFDPSSTSGGLDVNGNRNRPSFIALAHELAHAFDWDDGSVDAGTWFTNNDGRTVANAEKFASHVENLIRAENKIPLRAYYGIDGGRGTGTLIIPGTRMSANYFMNIGGQIVPYIYSK